MSLAVSDFVDFFLGCNGCYPFPWQERLCAQVLEGHWPNVIGLPTASGKTAMIDVAVFALAAGAPDACRRIAFVVDRRVVVDEAAERAKQLAACLNDPSIDQIAVRLQGLRLSPEHLQRCHMAIKTVAMRLRLIAGGKSPLVVSVLRGGIPPDEDWARTPTQAVVVLSTVDQVGSRLLFRAYGRHGPRSWPIHAGLLGRDTLIVLDEAHCARPFCQTLGTLVERFQAWTEVSVGRPTRFVTMSATAGEEPDFPPDDLKRIGHRGEELEPRLTAHKNARLVPVKASSSDRAALVDRIIAETKRLATDSRVVGVVVNRVADARAVFERLDLPADRKLLLTGRTRSFDRDRLVASWRPHLRAAKQRPRHSEPVVVVATQCIEVGANLDFDALVTECAALDSLRQRFGRLNRLGLQPGAEAAIVGFEQPDDEDPVYDAALARTWSYLWTAAKVEIVKEGRKKKEHRYVSFGVDALDALLSEQPPEDGVSALCAPTLDAPVLLPAHVDLLVQTSPPADPSPDVGQLLHGLGARSAEVTVVWRADLTPGQESDWIDRVAVQPPSVGEGCPVPIWAVRKWLTGTALPDPFGDIEGRDLDEQGEAASQPYGRPVLRWRGSTDAVLIGVRDLHPGDVIIAPAVWGGCDRYGWNPGSVEAVTDLGDAAAAGYRSRPVLRLDGALVSGWMVGEAAINASLAAAIQTLRDPESGAGEVREALGRLAAQAPLEPWARSVVEVLRDRGCRLVDAGGLPALVGRPTRPGADPEVSTSDDSSSLTIHSTLADHSAGVESWARRLASKCGLGDDLVEAVSIAAWLHDVGKADPRFQVWLHGGDEVAAAAAPSLLAKSDANPRNRVALERARQRARYPKGTRHETQSVAMIVASETLRAEAIARGCDWDLVLHLVASHHGFARPFVPVAENDADPVDATFVHGGVALKARTDNGLHRADSGIADRFWLLNRRYGWHGLAYLETILRLADHRRSEEEERAAIGGQA